MQNFDFNSLYEDTAKANHGNSGSGFPGMQGNFMNAGGGISGPEKFSQETEPKTNFSNSKKKKTNRIITFFLISIVTAFTFGLVAGIKLTAMGKKEGELIDPQTKAFLQKISQKGKSNVSEDPGRKRDIKIENKSNAANVSSKLFVKIYPSLSASKAQDLARALLRKKLSVHYSKLLSGDYFLYTGPYQKESIGLKRVEQIKKLREFQRINGKIKLVKR